MIDVYSCFLTTETCFVYCLFLPSGNYALFYRKDKLNCKFLNCALFSLQDFHHNPAILNYKPSHIAICCLSLALQTYGVQVPLTDENDDSTVWYNVSIPFAASIQSVFLKIPLLFACMYLSKILQRTSTGR